MKNAKEQMPKHIFTCLFTFCFHHILFYIPVAWESRYLPCWILVPMETLNTEGFRLIIIQASSTVREMTRLHTLSLADSVLVTPCFPLVVQGSDLRLHAHVFLILEASELFVGPDPNDSTAWLCQRLTFFVGVIFSNACEWWKLAYNNEPW